MTSKTTYADLLFHLSWQEGDRYQVEIRFDLPSDPAEWPPENETVSFDEACLQGLRASAQDALTHGNQLSEALLLGSPKLRSFLEKCLAAAELAGHPLRLRILVDRNTPRLNDLRWEMLRSLDKTRFLATDANTPLSRFLYSTDWQRIKLRPKGSLRALVVVANPSSLKTGVTLLNHHLTEVDVAGEVARAQEALHELPTVKVLASDAAQPGLVTLKNLLSRLAEGYDILYLVCHGALLPDDPEDPDSPLRPKLLLEDVDGKHRLEEAAALADAIRRMRPEERPRLVVLASCQSGGAGKVPASEKEPGETNEDERSYDGGALAALGPRLVDAGVLAVVAMQDNVKMATVRQFIPDFFQFLLKHGQVDLAMAQARGLAIDAQRLDWWSPVLYLRLRGGRLWYEPGFSSEENAEDLWSGILSSIEDKLCVPVVGSELLESLTGPLEELAMNWASKNGYPLAAHARQEMPQVAQYLATRHGPSQPRKNLEDHLKSCLKDKCKALGISTAGKNLANLLQEAGAAMRAQNEHDPYRILASLPISIYVNANPDNLLEQALIEQKKEPQKLYYCWNTEMRKRPEVVTMLQGLQPPTPEKPLLYYLFGHLENRETWVVSEDDYFDYLMWIHKPDNTIPDVVKTAWEQNALMFLGFQMSDWNFRVLYRSILDQDRRNAQRGWKSVAVQIQPGDDNLRPEGARSFLTQFFPSDKFNLYWGSAENFLSELWEQWKARQKEDE